MSYFNLSFTGINEEVKKTAFAVYWVYVKAICRCRVKLKHIIGKIKIACINIYSVIVVTFYYLGIMYLRLSYRRESSPLPVIITTIITLIIYLTLIYLFYYIAFALILIFINLYLNKKIREIDEGAKRCRVVPRPV